MNVLDRMREFFGDDANIRYLESAVIALVGAYGRPALNWVLGKIWSVAKGVTLAVAKPFRRVPQELSPLAKAISASIRKDAVAGNAESLTTRTCAINFNTCSFTVANEPVGHRLTQWERDHLLDEARAVAARFIAEEEKRVAAYEEARNLDLARKATGIIESPEAGDDEVQLILDLASDENLPDGELIDMIREKARRRLTGGLSRDRDPDAPLFSLPNGQAKSRKS